VVHTLLGRGSPLPTGAWAERAVELGEPPEEGGSREDRDRHRRAWGRFTRNFVVQGTGAEWALCWLADLRNRLWRLGTGGTVSERPHLVFFLHDEVVVHTPADLADDVTEEVRRAAAEAGQLLFGGFPVDFPLDVSVVESWADADQPGPVLTTTARRR
jgi:DNA polymerase-1